MAKKHPLRILIAEDNVVNQKVAIHILQRMGYRADVAANGLEVLAALGQQNYDLVFMDMQMPEMDGIEATKQIYQVWQAGKISYRPRIVAMTANAMQGDREACLGAGMDDYISKPIRNQELTRVLWECQPIIAPAIGGIVTAINAHTLHEAASDIGGEDEDFLIELIDSYLENSKLLLQDLQHSNAVHDFAVMLRTAHSFKSSSGMIGADNLASLCRDLETNLRQQNYQNLDSQINQILDEYIIVKSELEREKYKN